MKQEHSRAAVFVINSMQNGGAERVVVTQINELLSRNIEVYLILLHDKQYYPIAANVNVVIVDKENKGIRKIAKIPFLANKVDKELEKIYLKHEVILLTAHLPYTHYICCFSKYRKEFLFVMHNPQFHLPHSDSFLFKLRLQILLKNKKIIAVSDGVKSELVGKYGFNDEMISRIYNPIDYNSIDDALKKKTDNMKLTIPYIIFVGRLERPKNVVRLLEAFKESILYEKYKLVILGIGSQEKLLKKVVEQLNLEKSVLFLGWESNVYPWMYEAEMLVCSSDYESFGMVLAEALYCNCKVVSTNCDFGPREIMIGELSQYLSELDPIELSKKMRKAIDEYPDIKKCNVDRFDCKSCIDEYLTAYQRF